MYHFWYILQAFFFAELKTPLWYDDCISLNIFSDHTSEPQFVHPKCRHMGIAPDLAPDNQRVDCGRHARLLPMARHPLVCACQLIPTKGQFRQDRAPKREHNRSDDESPTSTPWLWNGWPRSGHEGALSRPKPGHRLTGAESPRIQCFTNPSFR